MTGTLREPPLGRAVRAGLTAATAVAAVAGTLAGSPAQAQDIPGEETFVRASAAVPAVLSSSADPGAAEAMLAAAAAGARAEVQRIALSGLPAELRTSAWNALRSTRGDVAITDWLAPDGGFDQAKKRLRDARSRNRQFCERVVRTHPAEFAPQTRAAAERALKGSDADRAAFVKTGYAQAQQSDRVARDAAAAERQAVLDRDREFVGSLAEHDPGEQVRVAAQWALRPGAADEDVREFYGFGWVTGATLDLEGHRLRTTDSEALRHRTLAVLSRTATEAEAALRDATDAAAARDRAERAWQAVASLARDAQTAWQAERKHAAQQAENWQRVQVLALADAREMWKLLAEPAEANRQSWVKEEQTAVGSAAFWQDILGRARDGETRVKG
ncbi:ALF repeat-containing protein [Streptomyces sp. NBC_00091]|uniref:ALF repeat-containing protein n=1 Tax=Streptomyces sp. NBC_00091 TaxID=2975648 RepID=UPI002250E16E|nr:ALF repeat-containing protein [Streptomyces sp. NBC_00091]MCX5377973.1 hypothetical protein [Streptomyces sp. NBC_00091]